MHKVKRNRHKSLNERLTLPYNRPCIIMILIINQLEKLIIRRFNCRKVHRHGNSTRALSKLFIISVWRWCNYDNSKLLMTLRPWESNSQLKWLAPSIRHRYPIKTYFPRRIGLEGWQRFPFDNFKVIQWLNDRLALFSVSSVWIVIHFFYCIKW